MATTACSTSDRSSSGGGGAGKAPGVTDTTIKVGGVNTKTTTFGFSQAGVDIGFKARIERANAEGGVNGRTIKFVGIEDDNGDQAKSLAATRKLVEQEQVFAVAPVESIAFGGGGFLKQNNVPYLGWGYLPDFCDNPIAFGFNGCLAPKPGSGATAGTAPYNALDQALGGAQGKTVAIIGADDPASKAVIELGRTSATKQGFTVTLADASLPQQQVPTDWSPYVRKILGSNNGKAPDVVVSMTNAPFNTGLFSALKASGYKGTLMESISYRDSLLQNPQTRDAYQGVLISAQIEPLLAVTMGARQMKADLEKVAGPDFAWTQDMAIGYATADVFLAILKAAGRDLTRDGFVKAAQGLRIESPIGGEISFPEGHAGTNSCASLVRVEGTRFLPVASLLCGPTFQV
ncbi:MAG: ABC transporter substrate-binding protein [Streptomycetaceae bacterium]|nr:ABC transporter substrate-binding protein [Streptomycetaceae bacterium]